MQAVKDAGYNIVNHSRWFNAIVIESQCPPVNLREEFPFVTWIRPVAELITIKSESGAANSGILFSQETDEMYGHSAVQNRMLNIGWMHKRGFRGEGVRVGVFDAGFYSVNKLAAFDSLWKNGRMIGYWDFSSNDSSVFEDDHHGMGVLSTMAANLPGEMIGTAPDASYLLARTEVASSETRQEEDNWVRALEWADSIGIDILHTSLGYSVFDSAAENYKYQDMNGGTAMITLAADKAAKRGILVVTSAGNEGLKSWRYITAPCDADSVLCVGAVDSSGDRAWFSSIGPTFDGRIKPEVAAMGEQAAHINGAGGVSLGNGTSYAAPMVAGLAACLMQAHPVRSNMDIYDAIRLSGSHVETPDSKTGTGIPDARKADSILAVMDALEIPAGDMSSTITHFWWYPDADNRILYLVNLTGVYKVLGMDLRDPETAEIKLTVEAKGKKELKKWNISSLPQGTYLMEIRLEGCKEPASGIFRK